MFQVSFSNYIQNVLLNSFPTSDFVNQPGDAGILNKGCVHNTTDYKRFSFNTPLNSGNRHRHDTNHLDNIYTVSTLTSRISFSAVSRSCIKAMGSSAWMLTTFRSLA